MTSIRKNINLNVIRILLYFKTYFILSVKQQPEIISMNLAGFVLIKRSEHILFFRKKILYFKVRSRIIMIIKSAGQAADLVGRRPVILAASALFLVGAVVCAAAPERWVLLGGRILLGIAIGKCFPI